MSTLLKIGPSALDDAIKLACTAHAGALDKQGDSYILHPLRVMMALKDDGFSEIYQIVGVLHDVVEDSSTTVEEITEYLGLRVGEAIAKLTHKEDLFYMDYIREIRSDPIALEVKKQDIMDNTNFKRFFHGVKYNKYAKAMSILMGQSK